LALGQIEGIGGGDFIKVAAAIAIYVLRLGYCRFQAVIAAKAMQASPSFNLIAMNRIDVVPGEKDRLLFQMGNRCVLAYVAC
jgi:hypothetical protein